ncbi:MAG: LruC domain-containing protein [Myxococcota bacterium]
MAYEDLFPSKGDYDFNDLVIRTNGARTVDSEGNVLAFTFEFRIVAVGAGLHNGFALLLDTPPSNVKSVRITRDGNTYEAGFVEPGHQTETVLHLFSSARDEMAPFQVNKYQFVQTLPGSESVNSPIYRIEVEFHQGFKQAAPYNPFIFRKDERGRETHLVGGRPSSFADPSYFQTSDDNSDATTNSYYVAKSGLPWGLLLPGEWKHPTERTDIRQAYPQFERWFISGGQSDQDWYQNPVPSMVWTPTP